MANNETREITLRINDTDARAKIENLKSRLEGARAQLDKLQARSAAGETLTKKEIAQIGRLQKEINRTTGELSKYKGTQEAVNATLRRLSGASVKELRGAIRALEKSMDSGFIQRGTKEWNEQTEALKRLRGELEQVRTERQRTAEAVEGQKGKKSLLSSIASQGGNIGGLVASVTTLGHGVAATLSTMREYVDVYASMQEAESAVSKYTGMTAGEVRTLNEAFKQMDTRTPREQLNALAGDAGRLGIQAKEDVLAFVEAADQINVALGADLGEDAVKQIGKLAQLFGDDKEKGLKGAMLATGSVINELAQSSSASESYLVDFAGRLAAVGSQAGISQAQIMAFGSVLDQNMVAQEKGATALQNIITALYRKPAQMARIAGLDIQKFTKQLRTDGNGALLSFIEQLNKAGRMDALAPMLDSMNLSGAGVTQTLTTLAGNIDTLRATQQQATEAFEKGTSVTEEFGKANTTAQAEIEKAQKRMTDLRAELGERLQPVFISAINGATTLGRAMMVVGSFVAKNAGLITYLTAVITTYIAVHKINTLLTWKMVASKIANAKATALESLATAKHTLLTKTATGATLVYAAAKNVLMGNTHRATAALRLLRMELLLNPYAAVAVAVLALGMALYSAMQKTKALTASQEGQRRAMSSIEDARKEAIRNTAEERTRIERLNAIVHDNTRSYDERKKALDTLRAIVPAYHAELSREGKLTRDNTNAITDYINSLNKKALAEAVYGKLVEANKKRLEAGLKVERKEYNVKAVQSYIEKNNIPREVTLSTPMWGTTSATHGKWKELKNQEEAAASARKELETANAEVEELNDWLKKNKADLPKTTAPTASSNSTAPGGSTTTAGGGANTATGHATRSSAPQNDNDRPALEAIEETLRKARALTEADYLQGTIDAKERQDLLLGYELEAAQKRTALHKVGTQERIKAEEAESKARQALQDLFTSWSLSDADRQKEETLRALEEQHATGILSETAYQEERKKVILHALSERVRLVRESGNTEELAKAEQAYTLESQKQKEEAERAHLERIKGLREKFAKASEADLFQKELADLEEAHAEKLFSEEAYLKALAALHHDHAQKEAEEKKARDAKDGWDEFKEKASNALPSSELATSLTALGQAVVAKREAMQKIEALERQGVLTHEQAEERKRQISGDKMGQIVGIASAAYATMGALVQGASQLAQASYEADAAKVSARYDAEIKAVGATTTRGKMLEEKKEKELREMKTKANKRAMAMQMAQALAMIPISAINAYNSAVETPIIGPVLAPIAAAAAVAAGMMQIATIKKQHEAQSAGYYAGGFTGGTAYRREAGVVHEGEFVANHKAVGNEALLPVLRLIDHAQRTNTVASLTAEDVRRTLPVSTATHQATPPAVIATTDDRTARAIEHLNQQLEAGITSVVALDGQNGLARQWKRYEKMNK